MGRFSDQMERAGENDPDRCESNAGSGDRCQNRALPGSKYCPIHGGRHGYNRLTNARKALYDLTIFKDEIEGFVNSEHSNSFRTEIGLLRLMMQKKLKAIDGSDTQLMLHAPFIQGLIKDIREAVAGATKLEKELGKLFTEEQALAWMDKVIDIIGRHVTDPDAIESICSELAQSFEEVKHGEPTR